MKQLRLCSPCYRLLAASLFYPEGHGRWWHLCIKDRNRGCGCAPKDDMIPVTQSLLFVTHARTLRGSLARPFWAVTSQQLPVIRRRCQLQNSLYQNLDTISCEYKVFAAPYSHPCISTKTLTRRLSLACIKWTAAMWRKLKWTCWRCTIKGIIRKTAEWCQSVSKWCHCIGNVKTVS